MFEQAKDLTPYDRDRIKLDFALFVAKRARRFHAEPDAIITVIAGKVSQDIARVFSPEQATEKAVGTPLAGEDTANSPASNSPETATDAGGFDSRSLTEIEVKPQVQVLPGAGDDAKGGSTGMERSDGGKSPAGESRPELQALPTSSRAGKPAGSKGSAAPTLASRIRALHAEHPEYTAAQAAEALGETTIRVQTNTAAMKMRWARSQLGRPVKPIPDPIEARLVDLHDEHPDWTARMLGRRLGASPVAVGMRAKKLGLALPEAFAANDEPISAPVVESPPRTIREPIAAIPSGTGSAIITKPIVRPKGTRFHLRDEAGLYLHNSCLAMTADRNWAWQGTADQLLACRKKFELARDLAEHVVEKEAARAA